MLVRRCSIHHFFPGICARKRASWVVWWARMYYERRPANSCGIKLGIGVSNLSHRVVIGVNVALLAAQAGRGNLQVHKVSEVYFV
jgi:hypothetical protein